MDGQIKPKYYQAVGGFRVGNQSVKVLEPKEGEKGKANGLPAYSNSRNSIYASVDHTTGTLERIRFFDENHKAKLDIEIHNEGKLGIILHSHEIDFEKGVPGKKKKTGRGPATELTPEIRTQFREYIALLGKVPREESNWMERTERKEG